MVARTWYILVFLTSVFLKAQSIGKNVVSNAGIPLSNGSIQLNFTLGEPIVGHVRAATFLDQGFWPASTLMNPMIPEENLTGIVVFPVPVEDILTIATGGRPLFGVQLFSIDRKFVFSSTVAVEQPTHEIDLGFLSKGVYVLQLFLSDESETILFKIIKE